VEHQDPRPLQGRGRGVRPEDHTEGERMRIKALRACTGAIVLSLFCACGATQRLHIETDPEGAEVYLMRRGEYEVTASVSGIGGSFDGDDFQEDFYLIGTTPVDYEFGLSDSEGSFSIPGLPAGASVTKHFREGVIRIVMSGYETEERTVQFSVSELNLVIALDPGLDSGSSTGEREAGVRESERE